MEPVWTRIFDHPEIIGVMLPVVGVIAFAIIIILKSLIRHRERMAMIERGIHPDCPPEDEIEKTNPLKTT
jgi:hypothetical protein